MKQTGLIENSKLIRYDTRWWPNFRTGGASWRAPNSFRGSRGRSPHQIGHCRPACPLTTVAVLAKLRSNQDANMKPPETAVAPASLLVELDSIVEPLVLAQLFAQSQPLEVELGCGDASFLVEHARRNPGRNFIGVERLLGRIQKLDRKGRRAGLANLRGVRIESAYFLQYLLPPHAASSLHIYFPDPWPKKKHRRHRLINENFPALARTALAPGGVVYLRTDDADYFLQMTEVFAVSKEFSKVETPFELAEVLTDFERDFNAREIPTLRAAYQLNRQGGGASPLVVKNLGQSGSFVLCVW
jgi:tRNA (guanine-N7-)-methyltransferase